MGRASRHRYRTFCLTTVLSVTAAWLIAFVAALDVNADRASAVGAAVLCLLRREGRLHATYPRMERMYSRTGCRFSCFTFAFATGPILPGSLKYLILLRISVGMLS